MGNGSNLHIQKQKYLIIHWYRQKNASLINVCDLNSSHGVSHKYLSNF